jgi:hypothetical protein
MTVAVYIFSSLSHLKDNLNTDGVLNANDEICLLEVIFVKKSTNALSRKGRKHEFFICAYKKMRRFPFPK